MNRELYDLMNWTEVEEIVYSESDNPHAVLGPHLKKEGLLIQAFLPGAVKAEVVRKADGSAVEMETEDEEGFFACLLPERKMIPYRLRVLWQDGEETLSEDPYAFLPEAEVADLRRFEAGNAPDAWRFMGAEETQSDGVSGTMFTVFAPHAMRVSVVGDFNRWDGRRCQMRRLDEGGVFRLFVPGVSRGALYKFEIKDRARKLYLRADPYARAAEPFPGTASAVPAPKSFAWTDGAWMEARRNEADSRASRPLSVFAICEGSGFASMDAARLREVLPAFLKKAGYTHAGFPEMTGACTGDSGSFRYTGYYVPSPRYGTPEDFRALVNALHENGIGVIADWRCARFPKDESGPAWFDGAPLYEYDSGDAASAVFCHEHPAVRNFVAGSALFFAEEYHIDGLMALDTASVLNYRNAGQDRQNMYGGGENLEGAAFLRSAAALLKERCPGFLLFADGSAEWPQTTWDTEEGLGFDFRKNNGWTGSVLHYMSASAGERSDRYQELTNPMLYQYSENFVLPLSLGEMEKDGAVRRDLAGFFYVHPGKKLTYGSGNSEIPPYLKDLNAFYLSHPALWKKDGDPEGFEWINFHSWKENVIAFLRKSGSEAEELLVVLNFSDEAWPEFNIGVPYRGSFREIFSSDREEYGGSGMLNPRTLFSRQMDVDLRENGITVKLPPQALLVFSCRRRGAAPQKETLPEEDRVLKVDKDQAKEPAGSPAKQMARAAAAAKKRAGEVATAGKKRAGEVATAGKKRAGEVAAAGKKQAEKAVSAGKRAVKTAQSAAQSAAEKVNALRGNGKEN